MVLEIVFLLLLHVLKDMLVMDKEIVFLLLLLLQQSLQLKIFHLLLLKMYAHQDILVMDKETVFGLITNLYVL